MDPPPGLQVMADRRLEPELRSWKPDFEAAAEKRALHVDPRARALKCLDDQCAAPRPERQVGRLGQKACPVRFVEREHATGPDACGEGSKRGGGVGKKLQDQAADDRIKWRARRNCRHIGLDEMDISQAGLRRAPARFGEGHAVKINSNDCADRANETCREQSDISDAGPHVEYALTGADTGVAESRSERAALTTG